MRRRWRDTEANQQAGTCIGELLVVARIENAMAQRRGADAANLRQQQWQIAVARTFDRVELHEIDVLLLFQLAQQIEALGQAERDAKALPGNRLQQRAGAFQRDD